MKKYLFLFLPGILLLMSSCASKKMVYLEDMDPDLLYSITRENDVRIKKDDKLSIVVKSKNPELAAPFNMEMGSYQIGTDGDVTAESGSSSHEKGYAVNASGDIDFPILGVLHVEGLTRGELAAMITNRLVREFLINDPLVVVDLLNLKVTMLGEVHQVGVLSIPDSRITLIEAIARAGGLTTNACVDKVMVIRETSKARRMIVNDLRSVDVFNSPAFYLQQNDIVYVHPRSAPATEDEGRRWRVFSTVLSLVGLAMSTFLLLKQ